MDRRPWRSAILAATTLVVAGGAATAVMTQASAASCGGLTYQATATLSGSTWTAKVGSSTVYTGTDMRAAVQAAISGLPSRTSKQNVLVNGSGSVSAGSRISLPSY